MIRTYNSKTNTMGNRYNLVVNEETKEIYFSGCHAMDKGTVQSELGIREVKRIYKEFLQDDYTEVRHSVSSKW